MLINLSYKNKIIQSKDVHYPDNVDALTVLIHVENIIKECSAIKALLKKEK